MTEMPDEARAFVGDQTRLPSPTAASAADAAIEQSDPAVGIEIVFGAHLGNERGVLAARDEAHDGGSHFSAE